MKKLIALALVLLTGCATGTEYIGKVGNVKFYSVCSSKFDGPNINALVSDTDGKVKIEQTFSGPGIGTAVGSTLVTTGSQLGSAVLAAEKANLSVTVPK